MRFYKFNKIMIKNFGQRNIFKSIFKYYTLIYNLCIKRIYTQ